MAGREMPGHPVRPNPLVLDGFLSFRPGCTSESPLPPDSDFLLPRSHPRTPGGSRHHSTRGGGLDANTVLVLGVALVVGLTVGSVPLVDVLRARSALRSALTSADGGNTESHRVPPGPDDLDPYQLALLCGGPVRVGETALMDAFLHGRIRQHRQQPHEGVLTLLGPSRHHLHEKDLVRRDLVKAFRGRAGVSAREVVSRVATGRGTARHRAELAEAGLIVDSPRLRRSLRAREKAAGTIRRMRPLGSLVAATGAGTLLLARTNTMPWALLVAGLSAVVALMVAKTVMSASGGPVLRPNTCLGNRVVEAARERYGPSTDLLPVDTRLHSGMTRDQAIRCTAVVGFRALRGLASARYDASRYDGGTGGEFIARGDATVSTGQIEPTSLEVLGAFAERCQSPPGGGKGDSSGEGWGGIISSDTESSGVSGESGGLGGGFGGGWGGDGSSDGGGGGGD